MNSEAWKRIKDAVAQWEQRLGITVDETPLDLCVPATIKKMLDQVQPNLGDLPDTVINGALSTGGAVETRLLGRLGRSGAVLVAHLIPDGNFPMPEDFLLPGGHETSEPRRLDAVVAHTLKHWGNAFPEDCSHPGQLPRRVFRLAKDCIQKHVDLALNALDGTWQMSDRYQSDAASPAAEGFPRGLDRAEYAIKVLRNFIRRRTPCACEEFWPDAADPKLKTQRTQRIRGHERHHHIDSYTNLDGSLSAFLAIGTKGSLVVNEQIGNVNKLLKYFGSSILAAFLRHDLGLQQLNVPELMCPECQRWYSCQVVCPYDAANLSVRTCRVRAVRAKWVMNHKLPSGQRVFRIQAEFRRCRKCSARYFADLDECPDPECRTKKYTGKGPSTEKLWICSAPAPPSFNPCIEHPVWPLPDADFNRFQNVAPPRQLQGTGRPLPLPSPAGDFGGLPVPNRGGTSARKASSSTIHQPMFQPEDFDRIELAFDKMLREMALKPQDFPQWTLQIVRIAIVAALVRCQKGVSLPALAPKFFDSNAEHDWEAIHACLSEPDPTRIRAILMGDVDPQDVDGDALVGLPDWQTPKSAKELRTVWKETWCRKLADLYRTHFVPLNSGDQNAPTDKSEDEC